MAVRREDCDYAAFYCEENVWRLAGHPALEQRVCHVVFISNPSRTCALWHQRAGTRDGDPVIWDYHVILAAERLSEPAHEILDLDSAAGFPLAAEEYLAATFPRITRLPINFQPLFRIIDAVEFRRSFASDRSHMCRRTEGGLSWIQPPPPWPAIQTRDQTMNLDTFVQMDGEGPGTVVDLPGFRRRFAAKTPRKHPWGSKTP